MAGEPSLSHRAIAAARVGSLLVLAVGTLVVAGWLYEAPSLTRMWLYGPTVKTNAGVALACGGFANLLLLGSARHRRRLAAAPAFLCTLIGALTLSEHLVGWDLGIDQLLATEPLGAMATTSPNRMGPPASLAFTLLGLSLLLVDSSHTRRRSAGLAAAHAASLIALLPLVGYAFELTALYSIARYTGIALATSVAILVLALSIMAGRPTVGLAGTLCRDDESGVMARRLFAAAVLLPFAVGWMLAIGFRANVVDGGFAISAMTLLLIIGLTIITWQAAARLGLALDQRLAAERALQETARSLREADAQKSAFLATLSHELRNPLAPIRFAVSLLDGPPGTAERARTTIGRQVDHLVRLVDDLLDLTRITHNKLTLERRAMDARQAITLAVDATAGEIAKAEHVLQVEVNPDGLWIHADPDRMMQVLSNLLTNAARYTPPGGHITIGVSPDNGHARFYVRDDGAGLTPDDAQRIFDMFVQLGERAQGGLGIGLALVRGLVELHGGTVHAHSDGPGRGSEFSVRLPLIPSPAGGSAGGPDCRPRERPCRILVVDDNADAADTLRELLESRGHTVVVAYDVPSALSAASGLRPEVGFFDLGLPGADGLTLARTLRQSPETETMLLVAITGWGQEHDRSRALAAGFDAHLTKPAQLHALVALVAERFPATAASAAEQP